VKIEKIWQVSDFWWDIVGFDAWMKAGQSRQENVISRFLEKSVFDIAF
jgi:hypothetical protein